MTGTTTREPALSGQTVVVIGGSAGIDGEVQGEVVVIGGTATLGPHADIRRDVTVVGGTLQRDPAAVLAHRDMLKLMSELG